MSVVFFLVGLTAFALALSGARPPLNHGHAALRPPWMQVMIVNEFAPTWFLGVAVLLALALVLGIGSSLLGLLAVVLLGATLVLLMVMIGRSTRSLAATRRALGPDIAVDRPRYRWTEVVFPYPYSDDLAVERIEDLAYAEGLELDLYRSLDHPGTPSPLLVHVHGGSWGGGNRREQAQPMIKEMARRGWIVAAVDYPLIPAATYPDQVVALQEAMRWLRDHAASHAIDTGAIFVTGGSAGAHLGSVLALTDGASPWSLRRLDEPTIAGAVVLYGIYDMLNRNGARDDWPFIARDVVKADPVHEVERFRDASPIDLVSSDAPPFLVIHGESDSLVPIAESEHFVDALRDDSHSSVSFIPVPGATHAFDAVPSLRTQNVVAGVASWLDEMARRRTGGTLGR